MAGLKPKNCVNIYAACFLKCAQVVYVMIGCVPAGVCMWLEIVCEWDIHVWR